MTKLNRWIYVAIGEVILMFAGLIYAWSVMANFIGKEFANCSNMQLSLTFTICMTCFCLGGLIGGILQKKIPVKFNILAASILFLIGFFIASKASNIIMLYVGYGVLCGFGSGLAYNGVISTVSKWFLDKQGLASGILLMGFGIGSFIMGNLFQIFTPDRIDGWRSSFLVLGIAIFFILLIGSFFIKSPPQEIMEQILSKQKQKSGSDEDINIDVAPTEMIKKSSFWFYFIWATLLGAAGLILISQAMGIATFIGEGISGSIIAAVVGLISVLNAVGRVICGAMYDKYGRLITMKTIVGGVFISAVLLILSIKLNSFIFIILGFCACGFSYGGVTSVNSAFINSFFGSKNYPINFSINNLNLIIASFGSTIAGLVYDITNTYIGIFVLMILLSVVSYICTVNIKRS